MKRVSLLWLDDYNSDIADFERWHARSVYFLDPGGNIVELIARFDLNDNVEAPFSSTQIRNVSEIGIVYPEITFDEDVNQLMLKYALGYFSKQVPLPHFRAIGDDNGLFIVVPENRVWFSTKDRKAGIYPIEIKFEENKEEMNLSI